MNSNLGLTFNLKNKDNRYDTILTANDILLNRLPNIKNIADLNKSHLFYLSNAYKPFVQTAFEYSFSNINGGNSIISNNEQIIKFTIPNFGDFTSDASIRLILPEIKLTNILDDTQIAKLKELNLFDTTYIKYCNYPGIRLLKNVRFMSSDFVIDEYDYNYTLLNKNFNENNRYNILVGQQQQKQASFLNNGITQYLTYSDGLQTPKKIHEKTEIIIPLEFDFCKYPQHALHNSFIANTTRTIEITLCNIRDLIQIVRINNNVEEILSYNNCGIGINESISDLQISMNLQVNNLMIPAELNDLLYCKINHQLIHKKQMKRYTFDNKLTNNKIKLTHFKDANENLMIGFREILDYSNLSNNFNTWHLFGSKRKCDFVSASFSNITSNQLSLTPAKTINFTTLSSIMTSMRLCANGIDIYRFNSDLFYNSYISNKYNNNNITISNDKSCYIIDFALDRGLHNPSGYFNITNPNDTYIEFETIKMNNNYEVIIYANSLNFLVKNKDKLIHQYY